MKTILFIGGTGAQGAAVVRVLAATKQYRIILFTRDTSSQQCKDLTSLPNVEAVVNPATDGYDLPAFEAAAKGCYGLFLNTDGFAMGEIAETYWGIRLYESAVKAGVGHVVYSGLDDAYRESGYDPDVYTIHFQGKSRVQGENEAALEAFRAQWKQEVQARGAPSTARPAPQSSTSHSKKSKRRLSFIPEPSASLQKGHDASEEVEPRAYHDLPDKEELLKLGSEGQHHDRSEYKAAEPTDALEHYERAVEKETQGQLGDSIKHYRAAFKLDDAVHEKYKQKHFAHAWTKKPTIPPTGQTNPSNASVTVPNPAHHSLHGRAPVLPASLKDLIDSFAELEIEAGPPPTDASPQEPSPLAELPEEILIHILTEVATEDVADFGRLALVCKRLAFLVLAEEQIWKRVALGREFGFAAMHYDYDCEIDGGPLDTSDDIQYLGNYDEIVETQQLPELPDRAALFATTTQNLLRSQYASSWRQMFRSRPRVRFNGCYISTVNYTRPGVLSTNTLSWGAPVHVVTYFRYLRFFRDGSVISLQTSTEPGEVVHHLTKDNLHKNHTNTLPSSVMRDALRGRWRLTGPMHLKRNAQGSEEGSDATTAEESEGDVIIETEGVVPKYLYKMHMGFGHAGKGARNNKLSWKGFWSYNKLADDWAEFGLKNDRAFYWSRVKSYGNGL